MLNLVGLKQAALADKGDEYEITVSCVEEVPTCKEGHSVVRNGTKTLWFSDTPMHGKRVEIGVLQQRYKCKDCGATLYSKVPHMDDKHRMTQRLYEYICRKGAYTSWKALGEEIGINPQTACNIWNEYADDVLKSISPVTPKWLGIDELHVMGKYRCVITNIKEHTLVNMLPERDLGTIYAYFLGALDPKEVEVVTMDMWDPYRQAVRGCFPNAKIVVDRFHVMMYASKAVEMARKSERFNLSRKKRVGLLGDRWLFLTARENLNVFQTTTLEAVLEEYPRIKEAYALKEAFRDVWKCKDRQAAENACDQWVERVKASEVEMVYRPLLSCLKNWREEIFGYMDWRLTNAYTESLNALARRLESVGRGYSFEALRKRMLMLHGSHVHKEDRGEDGSQIVACLATKLVIEDPSTSEPDWLGCDLSTLEAEVAMLLSNW